jgi:two-component system alkaline phosphatase synthesis response regulator PhoP
MYQGRILVVDDEVYILHILDFILGAEGYDVVTATNGEQANDAATQQIPVILLTAKGREVDQKLGREVGASDYITKPFSPNKLIERVQAILGVRK